MDDPGHHLSDREKARRLREGNSGILAFENSGPGAGGDPPKKEDYFPQEDEDEDSDSREEKEQPKPTVQLSNLPPNFTRENIKALFKETNPNMAVDFIRLIPAVPQGPASAAGNTANIPVRKATSAIVTLSTETPSSEIDALTSTLQNRYLGYGFWLSISRQLASAALAISQPFPTLLNTGSRNNNSSNPFGAKSLTPKQLPHGHSRAPPPSYHSRGFAPPTSFSSGGGRPGQLPNPNQPPLQVFVTPPTNLRMLKLIHKTVESVFTHGPEFEALLMSNESVRKDEKWSFLFDTRGEAHAYYRWRLWEVLSGATYTDLTSLSRGVEIFEGPNQPLWVPPKRSLRYEWAGNLEDIVDDPDYRSDGDLSGSDSDNDEGRRDRAHRDGSGPLPHGGLGLDSSGGKDTRTYLGPLKRAKLMWLVSRVPTSTTKVRRGDIARVMAFAIENAAAAEEVVEVLVGNVVRPLGFQKQLLEGNAGEDGKGEREGSTDDKQETLERKEEKERERETDVSGAKVVALYLLSDVLSNSSLGVRNAWRYRGLVEQKLREAKVMESLGGTYRSEGWGRIRREKFRRLVTGVLGLWESWNVFPQGTHEEFMRNFMEGGRDEREGSEKREGNGEGAKGVEDVTGVGKTKSRWKTVDTAVEVAVSAEAVVSAGGGEDAEMADGEDEDVDGVPMEDDDVDGVPLLEDDEDVDGVPMEGYEDDEGQGGKAVHEVPAPSTSAQKEEKKGTEKPAEETRKFGGMTFGVRAVGMGAAGPPVKRKRPKAEDMFADDDEED
ncbi:hypothetical protein BDZ91DRAFT_732763 [Kalaharituber pfeilii]|nr:hypothetical protein BDZ91DRAFT_732763 [Kalaharituber pfeilii]